MVPSGGSSLPFERSARGFKHMEPIVMDYPKPTVVRVYESSAALEPAIWVAMEQDAQCHAHLSLEEATLLRDQLTWLIENHYLGDSGV